MNKFHIKTNASILSRSLLLMIVLISSVNADTTTFLFEGVITDVDSPLRRTTTQIPTGFTPGDKFSGSYTFESDFPVSPGGVGAIFSYPGTITALSFSSDTNNTNANNGNILVDLEDQDDYIASFQTLSGDKVGDYEPISMNFIWRIHNSHPTRNDWPAFEYADLFDGPPVFPFFDNSLPIENFWGDILPPPNYGGITISYSDGTTSTASISGALYSVTVKEELVHCCHIPYKWVQP